MYVCVHMSQVLIVIARLAYREVAHVAAAADNPHIRSIFFRVRKLLLSGIRLVAVTDGV